MHSIDEQTGITREDYTNLSNPGQIYLAFSANKEYDRALANQRKGQERLYQRAVQMCYRSVPICN